MASAEDCEKALHELAERTAAHASATRKRGFDRTLSCTVRDLAVTFTGQLRDGLLTDIKQSAAGAAQIRLTLSSDDLVDLVAGRLKVASAWASGRLKVDASIRDVMKLRSLF